jgi:hypothetical protein
VFVKTQAHHQSVELDVRLSQSVVAVVMTMMAKANVNLR